MWWTEDKIRYYRCAAELSTFHREIALDAIKDIDRSDSVLELGAGLGYATREIHEMGYDIQAYEIDENAVRHLNLDYMHLGDAMKLDVSHRSDVVLMFFFGMLSVPENLDYFMNLADRRVIHYSSRHTGNGNSRRKDSTEDTVRTLDASGLKYRMEELNLEFSQPLESMEDAERFFSISYGNRIIPPLEKTDDEHYPFIFRNRKRIVKFIIEK